MLGISLFGAVTTQQIQAKTPASSEIINVAHATAASGVSSTSNAVIDRVVEVLDIGLAPLSAKLLTQGEYQVFPFVLTNKGNGQEAFALTGTAQRHQDRFRGFAIDADGDGVFAPGRDPLMSEESTTQKLAPGESLRLFALLGGTSIRSDRLTVRAHAVTGSGTPGTLFAALGDYGVDAIVGKTGAADRIAVDLAPAGGGGGASVELVKAQAVRAPDGSDRPVSGAIVTYSLTARVSGSIAAPDARLGDVIPAGTDYVPGSIAVDGARLTDAADADAAVFDGTAIQIALGELPAPSTRTIVFKVKIK